MIGTFCSLRTVVTCLCYASLLYAFLYAVWNEVIWYKLHTWVQATPGTHSHLGMHGAGRECIAIFIVINKIYIVPGLDIAIYIWLQSVLW